MKTTKTDLMTRLAAINNGFFNMPTHTVLIQDKTGEVTWPEMPDNINLISIKINFNTQEIKCTFSPLKPTVKLETIFRECYDQEDTCVGCRWYDSENQHCAFKDVALDIWPDIIWKLGYEVENKLW